MSTEISTEELLTRGVEQVIVRDTLAERLKSGEKIKIYFGIDPTGDKIHLGHSVLLHKLKNFQDLGHKIIFLIGNFTALIGDTSDKEAMRKMMTPEEVEQNFAQYKEQASKIIDFTKVEIRYNADWLEKLSLKEALRLSQQFTVQQMIERDMYQRRLQAGRPIGLHEFLYPLMQGYDSVALDVDLEIGGNDQTFNMLAGRTLQRSYNHKEKHVMACTLLEGTDGRKMSKSYDNVINLMDSATDMFGKVMKIKDELIIKYFTLCTSTPLDTIEKYNNALEKGENPKEFKVLLAKEIVEMYHSKDAAEQAAKDFDEVFAKGGKPEKIDNITFDTGKFKVFALLQELELVESRSEGKRMIEQGAVRIDGEKLEDVDAVLDIKDQETVTLQVGKRKWLEITGKEPEEDF